MRRFRTELKHLFGNGISVSGGIYPIDENGYCDIDDEKAADKMAKMPLWHELDQNQQPQPPATDPVERTAQLKKMSPAELMRYAATEKLTIFNRTADQLIGDIIEHEKRSRVTTDPAQPKTKKSKVKKDTE